MGFRDGNRESELLQVETAQARVLEAVSLLGSERVALTDALGRVIREDVASDRNVPPADNSAMDGYAVIAADIAAATRETPVLLDVIEDLPAGYVATKSVAPGTSIRIMTGAPVPAGANAVVQVEETDAGSSRVAIYRALRSGANIRSAGEDLRVGDVVVRAGTPLGSGEIGVLATLQRRDVEVSMRPAVAILSTGDEVVEIDEELTPGRIVNSNAWSLAALAREAGAVPRVMPIVRDDRDATITAIEEALAFDFIVSTGGVSAGAYDFVKEAMECVGLEIRFSKVAMKPGKPVVFAARDRKLYFGLPGNPVSCMVSFLLFVAPALRKAMGQTTGLLPPSVSVPLEAAVGGGGGRRTYVRVRVHARDGRLVAIPMKAQGSGVTSSMLRANGLAILEPGRARAEAGDVLETLLIGPIHGD
ncbi:MAG: molybdopterin molybdotransferase MoeA [Thermoanaerobaculia bacterium]